MLNAQPTSSPAQAGQPEQREQFSSVSRTKGEWRRSKRSTSRSSRGSGRCSAWLGAQPTAQKKFVGPDASKWSRVFGGCLFGLNSVDYQVCFSEMVLQSKNF